MESLSQNDTGKIIKSFCVVGLNESKLTKYNEVDSHPFVQNIDILQKTLKVNMDKIEKENEKWIKIIKTTNCWLRIQYSTSYHEPITDFKIVECEYSTESPDYLVIYLYNKFFSNKVSFQKIHRSKLQSNHSNNNKRI